MASKLDKQLAKFLLRERGQQTFAQFGKKIGLPPSTLFRLERCEQSITLGKLDAVLKKLKRSMRDVFEA